VAKRKILIVSGDTTPARDLEARLDKLGYDVVGIATSESDAIAMTATTAPELVLMDRAARDELKRAEAAEEFRQRWRIPVVLMIAETDGELRANIELALCRHDTANAVHDLEDRFFASSIDMLCFLDFSGYFKRLNPAWERTLGFTREELMSRPFIEFVHPDDRERTLSQNAHVRSGGKALAFENRYLCKDGSFRWFHWNAAPDSAEKVIYSVARDITASKQAAEERERLVGELQTALAEVKTLREILPICSYCRKVRDDENYWHTVESYISRHTTTRFSHSECPSCMESEVDSRHAGSGP
jgi:PAS domain S-box-containing protein